MTQPLPPRPKSAWPLLTVAFASFIPVLGFFFGAAAVSWGLVTDRPRARLAIGVGAAGALLWVVVLAAAGWMTRDTETMKQAVRLSVVSDLTKLALALDAYREDRGSYPSNLPDFVGRPVPIRLVNIYDHSTGVFSRRLFEYRPSRDGRAFDLFSVGGDGQPGTEDDLRPVLPDSMLERTGYRPSLEFRPPP